MLDLTTELQVGVLIAQVAKTASITAPTPLNIAAVDTGDLDMLQIMITALAGSPGTIVVQLQGSPNGSSGWVNLPTTPLMPATSLSVAANMTAPATLPIDPRALGVKGPYIRAIATMTTFTGYTIEVLLFSRNLQTGFPSTSG